MRVFPPSCNRFGFSIKVFSDSLIFFSFKMSYLQSKRAQVWRKKQSECLLWMDLIIKHATATLIRQIKPSSFRAVYQFSFRLFISL